MMPWVIYHGMWVGRYPYDFDLALILYAAPSSLFLISFSVIASMETRYTYGPKRSFGIILRRMMRLFPYAVINTAMLPHQCSSFMEGLFGTMHAEFERTPKTASGDATKKTKRFQRVKVHAPYVIAELFFVIYNLCWTVLFLKEGNVRSACGPLFIALCVVSIMWFYGDHVDQRLFVLPARPFSMARKDKCYEEKKGSQSHMRTFSTVV